MKPINWRLLGLVGLLFSLPFLRFWQLWLPALTERFIFAGGDFVEQHVLMRTYVATELQSGSIPLWGPYTFSGKPALADSLLSTLYPLSWWQAWFSFTPTANAPFPTMLWLLEMEMLAHLGLGGFFMFLLVRQLTGSLAAAVISGLAFGLSGFLTGYALLQIIILQAAVWLPASIWLIELGLDRRSFTLIACAGAALGLSVLAGHIQTTTFVAYTSVSYFIFRAFHKKVGWRFLILAGFLWGLTTLALSAGQWVPSVQLHQLSPRAEISYFEASFGFALQDLWGLLRPDPNGNWSPLYVGVVSLLGVAIALLQIRRAEIWFWATFAVITILLSLGRNGPLYPLIYNLAPDLQFFRAQERTAFPAAFALIVLGGYGLAWYLERLRWQTLVTALAVGLVFFDLARLHTKPGLLIQPLPTQNGLAPTVATEFITQQPNREAWRVSSEGLLPGGGNAGMYWRVRDVTGNTPLFLGMYGFFFDTVPEVRWWQLLNVRYALTHRTIEYPGLTLALDDTERDQRLYELDLGGKPLWITHQYEVAPDQASAIGRTSDLETLDPLVTTVLEKEPQPAPQPTAGAETEFARLTSFSAHQLTAEANLAAPGVVIFSEIDYPGWNVYVNGQPTESLRAFGLLRAVALPAGQYTLEWRFESWPFYIGLSISLLTATGLLFAVGRLRLRKIA